MKNILLTNLIIILSQLIYSQTTFNPIQQSKQVVWGNGYGQNSFNRFPADAQNKIPGDAWNQAVRSSGLHVRFKSNATSITVNYNLSSQYTSNNWFSAVGANGVDMYAFKPGEGWQWCYPNTRIVGSYFTYSQLNPDDSYYNSNGYEYVLYFPTFAITSSLSITVNSGANFEFVEVPQNIKPIVMYGTSIIHGAACSRPGNAITGIIGRTFSDRPIINLGFSGAGKVEPEVIDVINRIDAEIFIIDCLPNYSTSSMPQYIESRYKSAVDTLTKYHPNAAILLTEHVGYADMEMWKARKDLVILDNSELRKVYQYFIDKGYKNLYYLSKEEINFNFAEDIADYIHPNDKGMYKFAAVYTDKINHILSEQSSAVKNNVSASNIQLFPNPNNGSFVVKNQQGFRHDELIEIFDSSGKVVYSGITVPNTIEYLIEQNNLIKGNYILSLKQKNASNNFSFVVN
ncbi:MAG: SGNH/GDSL hydrolase family protein [Paludibacter sp.]|nr:SGNH/GDSL hydrolase family protein [Paludibacter sp.]